MSLIRSLPSRSYAGKAKITDEFLLLDFKGEDLEDVTELDYDNLVKSIQSGKLIKIINLVVDDKVFNGIANATYDETNKLVEFVINNYNVKVENDGATTYGESGKKIYEHNISLSFLDEENDNMTGTIYFTLYNNTDDEITNATKLKEIIGTKKVCTNGVISDTYPQTFVPDGIYVDANVLYLNVIKYVSGALTGDVVVLSSTIVTNISDDISEL